MKSWFIQGHASRCCNQDKDVDVLALSSISFLHSRVHFSLPFICQENILVNKCLEADFLETSRDAFLVYTYV